MQRHSCLTLVQLQQLQPNVDLDALLESPGGELEQPSRKQPAADSQTMLTGVRINAGLADHTHWDEPALILECLFACAQ